MKYLLAFFGFLSLALGIIGIFLPLLPTTPFLLLSAFLFARSSERLHRWLLGHKVLGEYIRNFLQEKTIPLRIKIYSISALWAAIICSIALAATGKLYLQVALAAIAAGVTAHILSYKTKRPKI
ncbi:MAG: YbaN family protein [Prevotellaceae bacterium]|nr:YbaN family protein [Prevotellaceae bacterium]